MSSSVDMEMPSGQPPREEMSAHLDAAANPLSPTANATSSAATATSNAATATSIGSHFSATDATSPVSASDAHTLAQLRCSVVGHGSVFDGPFGRKTLVYADWTASGRALAPVEDYLRREVLPMYANTHTTTSGCGLQSTCFRQEARQVINHMLNPRFLSKMVSYDIL